MTFRTLILRALEILVVAAGIAAVLYALGWIAETDRQVERASLEAYCTGVATWKAEAARGVPELQRTGHPDWRDTAAEQCPGLRPAENAQGLAFRVGGNSSATVTSSQRQLAQQ